MKTNERSTIEARKRYAEKQGISLPTGKLTHEALDKAGVAKTADGYDKWLAAQRKPKAVSATRSGTTKAAPVGKPTAKPSKELNAAVKALVAFAKEEGVTLAVASKRVAAQAVLQGSK